jgi:eight-cysteine-cluster-containing protein
VPSRHCRIYWLASSWKRSLFEGLTKGDLGYNRGMKNIHVVIAIVIVLVLILLANWALNRTTEPVPIAPIGIATSTATSTPGVIATSTGTTSVIVRPTPVSPLPPAPGDITIPLNKKVIVNGISITPLRVTEDSRCPKDVQCIWAGRVAVETRVNNTTYVFNEGSAVKVGDYTVTLKQVWPYPTATGNIAPESYKSTFTITKNPVVSTAEKCYVGGCSGQVCSDQEGIASTCEYREVYSCYKTAKCERQSNGQCGWTETAALKTCIQQKS